jgi:hypothetical protein
MLASARSGVGLKSLEMQNREAKKQRMRKHGIGAEFGINK